MAFSRPFFGEAEAEAAAAVVRSGWVVGGPRLAEFEQRFAALCGAEYAVGVSSWTTGAFLVLYAWGIGPGDEVIVPSLTFIATVNVIRHVGATPVFAEIDPDTFNIDPADAARRITSRTRVIMPVDQLGLPSDIDAIGSLARRHGLRVLDDAACAFGSRNQGRPVGGLADATVFSLHARKIVTTAEGGMITTGDAALAERLRRLRHQGMSLSDYARHGQRPTQFESYPEIGYNHRVTDIQAAIGLAQLNRLDDILERRRAVAARYQAHLAGHPVLIPPHVPTGLAHNWQSYQVRLREHTGWSRNEMMDRLFEMGIPTRRGVMAAHLEPPYRHEAPSLPLTESTAASTLQLPIHPGITAEQQDRVLRALDRVAAQIASA
ncbi:MAG: DegT/DnrJ/EryC1/StrS family aminotransferase [Alphaproteobacteria bacterium]|nr:DegT/DnrJ/EryC1/StrS family aminotransferase [Alphaproteobacteria bacterium]